MFRIWSAGQDARLYGRRDARRYKGIRTSWVIWLLLVSVAGALAAEDTLTLDDELLRSAEQWAKENLDDDALRVLQEVDRDKVRQFLAQIQKELHGEYVIDLATLRDSAKTALPLLENYEETLPYALWLKPRLDYLDVADELRLIIPAPKEAPGQPRKPIPNPAPEKAREIWVTKFANRPWPKRAQVYVPRLKPIFLAQQVPAELVWVAEVESSFDPRARSPDGAAGLFQLMPATAKRYGLRTWPFDQRLRPEESAQAAAHYLRYLYGRFKDWRLALAAYNAGEGTIEDLLARKKSKSFEAIAAHLPAETQMYVPKFEAILLRREGLKLAQLKLPKAEATGAASAQAK
ncbi:MAG TPA: lytic transglycosylase domain-containing protein [Candidatus Limnocylindrales bacterium]|jgi:membrane-bound lytic murein transglycosylase D|nr:lytic transglycosylase domain-containing protein [Candidatus Limnocylindrales bacterium]